MCILQIVHMGTTGAETAGTFGAKLGFELDSRGMGLRTLARKLERAEGRTTPPNPKRVEAIRRSLNKYLHHGRVPQDATRHAIEETLGLERDSLKPDDDPDDEGEPPLVLTIPVQVSVSQVAAGLDYALLARAVEAHRAAAATA